ncbi:PucR family transcriptional regulator [Paractinoplanes lichenicola]|uniref:Helix-turn-helix domain-containing protein n=1 Tax=Paractinoplanes lichenicola TaxID=2802976 RepID=A0ABS1VVP3_9ACTN|nr:helix-turn-helix domain-containing protein [Actinoplanes lichenicola]MBL7258539.1 helix-turn-helix domain-containing protein [Actinoplanes lichenicola]
MTTTVVAPLPRWAREAADAVDLPALADRVVEVDLAAAFETLRENDEFVDRLRASVVENLSALRQVLTGRLPLAEVRLTEPFALAALQARLRLPQTALQRSYRVGFRAMWQEWSDQLVARAEADDVPRGESLAALQALTELVLAYQHHAASQVADTFARTDDVLSRSRDHVRAGLVQHLLRDDSTPLPPSDLVLLDYPLDAAHLAVLLPATPEGCARQILDTLRDKCHVRDTLVHPIDLTSTVVWLAQPRQAGWTAARIVAITDCLRSLGLQASVSEPHVGVQGVRDGWRQVRDVQSVRAAWGSGVLSYADVSLEVLLMADPARARAFVRAELGELGAEDEIAARLRETVEASHRFGSHVTTAAHLHLHEHTVRNRLQKAAELLGRPLTERRTELQVALRLARLLIDA